MESAYGIGVHNRYALFLDEDDGDALDPYALLTQADTDHKTKAAAAVTPANATVPNAANVGVIGSGGGAIVVGNKSGPNKTTGGGTNKNSPGAAIGQKATTLGGGTLSESKVNVTANQKDSGMFILYIFIYNVIIFY